MLRAIFSLRAHLRSLRTAILGCTPLKSCSDGQDYLPATYNSWLADESKTMYVVETGGIAVGLDTLSLFDNGTTVMFQALRVDAHFRGCGVAKQLSRVVNAYVPRDATRLRVTTRGGNAASIALHERQGFKVVLQRRLVGLFLPASALPSPPLDSACQRRPSQVSAQQLFDLLLREDASAGVLLSPRLFPKGCIILNWEAFIMDRVVGLANLLRIERAGWAFYVEVDELVTSVSFGVSSRRVNGSFHTCSIYCAADVEAFAVHAAQHVDDALMQGDRYTLLKVDTGMDGQRTFAEAVELLQAEHGATTDSWSMGDTLLLLEKPILNLATCDSTRNAHNERC